jgi:hypothetical protein
MNKIDTATPDVTHSTATQVGSLHRKTRKHGQLGHGQAASSTGATRPEATPASRGAESGTAASDTKAQSIKTEDGHISVRA